MKKLHKKKSLGVRLTQERLKDFYKGFKSTSTLKFIDLVTEAGDASGTKVVLTIPLV